MKTWELDTIIISNLILGCFTKIKVVIARCPNILEAVAYRDFTYFEPIRILTVIFGSRKILGKIPYKV